MRKLLLLLATSLMAIAQAQEGGIIYRDFEPDLYVGALTYNFPHDTIKVDIDQDGTTDFKIFMGFVSSYGIVAQFTNYLPWYYRGKSGETDTIVPMTNPNRWLCLYDNAGMFTYIDSPTVINDTLGFRKTIDGENYYAWMTVNVTREINGIQGPHGTYDKVQAYVKEVAYCTIPDYPLRWGQISLDGIILNNSEWYYEIQNDNGSITYQHLECVGDTLFDRAGKRPKIIVRSNTHYDRDTITEVTHEYVYEENGKVYWWNQDLQEFTTLYDLTANAGDEWEIKVGTESLTMHVNAVEIIEYEGHSYRMLHVSDSEDLFSGDIVCNFGHMTSFFPERLMNRGKDYTVDGLRCYWIGDELIFHNGDEDCDAIYDELHGVEEGPSTGSGTAGPLSVYPNPASGVLFVETYGRASLSNKTYRITNLMGQTLLQGLITAETQQIDITNLPAGMYFISVGEQTVKFVKQ